jgi:preprotein translocase subunit SecY
MLKILKNVFSIPELRNKILFTIGMLIVYRIGFWIPLPGVNQVALAEYFATTGSSTAAGKAAAFVAMFAGGALSQSTIFGLGIMPYISASIIFQILTSVSPTLKKLQEEGPTGRQKIMEWTRYATVILCVFQAIGWLMFLSRGGGGGVVDPMWVRNPVWWITSITMLTAGTCFLMWLGEQIDRPGIGNGVSLIITAGIITGMPGAIKWIIENFDPTDPAKLDWMSIILLVGGFLGVVMGAVLMTVAQRRIPVQQAKHTRGRRVFGGQRSYLPLRVNHSGVMPVIFATSLMIFPQVILGGIGEALRNAGTTGVFTQTLNWFAENLTAGQFLYVVLEAALIFFFSYVWITIPGLRPGPRTAEYLEAVMERITFVGAGMLCVIALLPQVISTSMGIDWSVSQFLGGTGLLICVSVSLDLLQRIEANLLMRNYAGFLGGDDASNAPRMRGPRG